MYNADSAVRTAMPTTDGVQLYNSCWISRAGLSHHDRLWTSAQIRSGCSRRSWTPSDAPWPQGEFHRAGPNCAAWPSPLAENLYQSWERGPHCWPTLCDCVRQRRRPRGGRHLRPLHHRGPLDQPVLDQPVLHHWQPVLHQPLGSHGWLLSPFGSDRCGQISFGQRLLRCNIHRKCSTVAEPYRVMYKRNGTTVA